MPVGLVPNVPDVLGAGVSKSDPNGLVLGAPELNGEVAEPKEEVAPVPDEPESAEPEAAPLSCWANASAPAQHTPATTRAIQCRRKFMNGEASEVSSTGDPGQKRAIALADACTLRN